MSHALPELVCCAGGNPRVAEIAVAAGFRYGARLPATTYAPVWFADQDWRKPDRVAYVAALAQHRPTVATVLDWEHYDQLSEVLAWTEDAAQFVESVIIIPKVPQIPEIPLIVGGKTVILGYSVPTSFGATTVPLPQFYGRKIHLLGGSPEMQMRLWRHFRQYAQVVSVDGNSHLKLANRGLFWAGLGRRRSLKQADGRRFEGSGNLEAFRRSCRNIKAAWEKQP